MAGSSTLVTITTWNVQHANPSRTRDQVNWIAGTAPASGAHVLVLTETARRSAPGPLTESLCTHGYSATPSAVGDYGVVLAVRGAQFEHWDGAATAVLPHRCRGAKVFTGGRELALVGLYVPSRGPAHRRNEDKRAFQAAVTGLLPALAEESQVPLVVAGDLNVVEPGYLPRHHVFGRWEYDFYDSFAAHRLDDAFRHLHPEAVEHSWFGRRSGLGYRFDHLFLSRAHLPALVACSYDPIPLRLQLSDHSAMSMTLDLARLPSRASPSST